MRPCWRVCVCMCVCVCVCMYVCVLRLVCGHDISRREAWMYFILGMWMSHIEYKNPIVFCARKGYPRSDMVNKCKLLKKAITHSDKVRHNWYFGTSSECGRGMFSNKTFMWSNVRKGQLGVKNYYFCNNSRTQCQFGLGVALLWSTSRSTSGWPLTSVWPLMTMMIYSCFGDIQFFDPIFGCQRYLPINKVNGLTPVRPSHKELSEVKRWLY